MSASKKSVECSGESRDARLSLEYLLRRRIKQNAKARMTSIATANGMPKPTAILSARENPDSESDPSVRVGVARLESELAVTVTKEVATTVGNVGDADAAIEDAEPDADVDEEPDAEVEAEVDCVESDDCDESADVVVADASVLGPNSLVK